MTGGSKRLRWWRMRRYFPKRPHLRVHIRNGRESGYPACCIAWFCAFQWLPDRVFDRGRLWDLLRVPDGRGYVPCPRHYRTGDIYGASGIQFVGFKECPWIDASGSCTTPSDCRDLGECRIAYRWSLNGLVDATERLHSLRASAQIDGRGSR